MAAVVVSLIAARVATNEAASKAVLSALSNPQKLLVVLFKAALITFKLPVVMLRKLLAQPWVVPAIEKVWVPTV
mgnify:CR=1 FL=1